MHDPRHSNQLAVHGEDDAELANAQTLKSTCVVTFEALDIQTMPLTGRVFAKLLQRGTQHLPGLRGECAQKCHGVAVLKDEPIHRSSRFVQSYASG